jgi:ATP-dependent protease Clp ATPase subunit
MTRCSFCGKSPDDVRVILTSRDSAICDECVLTAFDTISNQPGHPLYLRVAYSLFVAVASVGSLLTVRRRRSN